MQPSTLDSRPSPHSDNEVLVRVEGVSKKFCRSLKRSLWYGVCDIAGELSPFGRRPRSVERRVSSDESLAAARSRASGVEPSTLDSGPSTHDHDGLRSGEFWAVNDVSFELRRGECLGLIGHNGAGKTTLLKMLNGLIKPDTGRIEMNGRVGALIALGAGFNPVLTGRENIYIYGSILGLERREIDDIFDQIIDFAEIREFIDMPVQSYSSGMAVRLGFAVASSLRPDILLLDEVLAVGDIGFVVKCLNRLRDIASDSAVILVSHNMQSISGFCSRVVMLERGHEVIDTDNVTAAIDRYYESAELNMSEAGTGDVKLLGCELCDADQSTDGSVCTHKTICVCFEVSREITGTECQIDITDRSGVPIVGVPVMESPDRKRLFAPGSHRITASLDCSDLSSGNYQCTLVFRDARNLKIYNRTQGVGVFRIHGQKYHGARVVRPVIQ
jgi:lipopolysaccharide transport system ATP-binding protein